jgi:hypothetical protein
MALPDDERSGERPYIMGFNDGWDEALRQAQPVEHDALAVADENCGSDTLTHWRHVFEDRRYSNELVGNMVRANAEMFLAALSRQPVEADGWLALLQEARQTIFDAGDQLALLAKNPSGNAWVHQCSDTLDKIDAFLSTTAKAGSEDARR